MKALFLENEIWMLTINGAFQRANVYVKGTEEKERNVFKAALHKHLQKLVADYYLQAVDELVHIANIESIMDISISKGYSFVGLNFGVSQKLLNLYLKYLWCLDLIPVPPHFPVDRQIQKKLEIKEVISWTQMEDKKAYLNVIEIARKVSKEKNFNSIAELELHLFSKDNH